MLAAFEPLLKILQAAAPLLAVVVAVIAGLFFVRYLLEARLGKAPDAKFRIQVVMLALSFAGLLTIITALPVSETLRGQLLSLVGLLLSASIALSSTTFLGNAMAGVQLRVVGGFRMGDLVRVGEHFGRISGRGLFHTEIQTENRDLTTLPNLYLVSNPIQVIRGSGTIISAQVSLGYDVSRRQVERALLEASSKSGLQDGFVQILELGDFSVLYRIAGLLADVQRILSAGSSLRGAVLDELHSVGIEIVSPNFMNTRALKQGVVFAPSRDDSYSDPDSLSKEGPEDVVFDKAEEAKAVEDLEAKLETLSQEIENLEQELKDVNKGAERYGPELRLRSAKAEFDEVSLDLERAQKRQAIDS